MNSNNRTEALTRSLGVDEIRNAADYHDGFSFTVKTELEAYRAAHKYQGPLIKKTVVKYAPNIGEWSVHIYSQEAAK